MKNLTFWKKIVITFVDAPSYSFLMKESFRSTLLFFALMMILISPLYGLKVVFITIPSIIEKTTTTLQEFSKVYPEGTTVTWDQSQLLVSPADTYSLEYPSFFEADELGLPQHSATFISEELNPNQFSGKLDPLPFLVVTPRFVYLQDNSESWSSYPLNQLLGLNQNFEITKESLESQSASAINQLTSSLQKSKWIIFLLSPLVVLITTIFKSTVQVLLAFVIVVKLQKDKLTFRKFTQLSLHVIIIATTIDLITGLLYPDQPLHVFTASYWMLMLYVMYTLKVKEFTQD
jgi:hypothetical protein